MSRISNIATHFYQVGILLYCTTQSTFHLQKGSNISLQKFFSTNREVIRADIDSWIEKISVFYNIPIALIAEFNLFRWKEMDTVLLNIPRAFDSITRIMISIKRSILRFIGCRFDYNISEIKRICCELIIVFLGHMHEYISIINSMTGKFCFFCLWRLLYCKHHLSRLSMLCRIQRRG